MRQFEKALYEGVLVSFGKVLAKYNAFAQGAILREMGQELTEYLARRGFAIEETGTPQDIERMVDLFVRNGFADSVEVEQPAPDTTRFTWHNLYGAEAYKELQDVAANPFLSCPLNVCVYYVASKYQKRLRLLEKTFELEHGVVRSEYHMEDAPEEAPESFDPLVIENARLYELARERADGLEKAMSEIKTLRGILPICLACKKVRDDAGYWQQVDVYVRDHSEVSFSHGYCPDCAEKALAEATGATNGA